MFDPLLLLGGAAVVTVVGAVGSAVSKSAAPTKQ
jgi:hypothetical protein